MKSGFLTTEFWLSLAGFVAGLVLIVIGAVQHDKGILELGVYLMLGGSVPYAGVRALVKAQANKGFGAETQERANEMLRRMLDFAEQHIEKLKPTSVPSPVFICPSFVAGEGGLCAVCKSPRFGHPGVEQDLAPFTAIDLSEVTQHLTDADFEELIKAAKFDRQMRSTSKDPEPAS